jgi:PAS domain S-box-containing protein
MPTGLLLGVGILLSAGTFLLDLLLPPRLATGVLYAAILVLVARALSPRPLVACAVIISLLCVLAPVYSLHPDTFWDAISTGNLGLELAVIWATVLMLRARARRDAERQADIDALEGRVEERTSQLRQELARANDAEKRFRDLLESAPDAVIITNADGRMTLVNREAERMFGYARAKLIDQPVEMLVPHRFRARHPGYRRADAEEPRLREMGANLELTALRRDGTEFPVEISLSPIATDDGLLVSTTIRDVSRRKQAERKFRGLLESAPVAMVIVDEAGHIVLVNGQTERLFGYRRDEMLEQPVELLIPERFRAGHAKYRAGYSLQPRVRQMGLGMRLHGRRKDGSEFPVEVSLSPLQTEDGSVLVSSAIRDVTETLRTAELERKNEELQMFAHVASHDLREPLRMISSYVQLLAERYRGRLGSDADDFIHYAVDGVHRMEKLLDALLDYARVGSRARPFEEVDTGAVLEDVKRNLILAIENSAAVVEAEAMPRVRADPTQVAQLLQNLIANALKFRGEKRPHVELSATLDGEHWRFCVRDNGIGIDPKHRERIFGIFERLHTSSEYPGTGIGLSICKRIVERHGGRIWVESEPGQGAHFYFTLPATDAGNPA